MRAMKQPEPNQADSHSRAGETREAVKKTVTVLHVDDDPNDTTLLQVACARAGVSFQFQNISEAAEAFEYLSGTGKYADRSRYEFPELVLLDMKMPQATGLDVLNWIRSHSNLKHLPVFVLSGSDFKDDVHLAYDRGADFYLVKPPTFDSLVNLVKDISTQLPAAALRRGGASRSCAGLEP